MHPRLSRRLTAIGEADRAMTSQATAVAETSPRAGTVSAAESASADPRVAATGAGPEKPDYRAGSRRDPPPAATGPAAGTAREPAADP